MHGFRWPWSSTVVIDTRKKREGGGDEVGDGEGNRLGVGCRGRSR